jgi:hypothetical protein
MGYRTPKYIGCIPLPENHSFIYTHGKAKENLIYIYIYIYIPLSLSLSNAFVNLFVERDQ